LTKRVLEISNLIHNTKFKTHIAFSQPDHPKLYQWDTEKVPPWEEIRAAKFHKHYKPILRQLLLHHKSNPQYKQDLRNLVQLRHEQKMKNSEVEGSDEALKRILGTVSRLPSDYHVLEESDCKPGTSQQLRAEETAKRTQCGDEEKCDENISTVMHEKLKNNNGKKGDLNEDSFPTTKCNGALGKDFSWFHLALQYNPLNTNVNGRTKALVPPTTVDLKALESENPKKLKELCQEALKVSKEQPANHSMGEATIKSEAISKIIVSTCNSDPIVEPSKDNILNPIDELENKMLQPVTSDENGSNNMETESESSMKTEVDRCAEKADIDILNQLASNPLNADDITKVLGEDNNNSSPSKSEPTVISNGVAKKCDEKLEAEQENDKLSELMNVEGTSNSLKDLDILDSADTLANQVTNEDLMETIDSLVTGVGLKDSDLMLNVFDDFCGPQTSADSDIAPKVIET